MRIVQTHVLYVNTPVSDHIIGSLFERSHNHMDLPYQLWPRSLTLIDRTKSIFTR